MSMKQHLLDIKEYYNYNKIFNLFMSLSYLRMTSIFEILRRYADDIKCSIITS